MRYAFEWDPMKARANLRKHRVSFESAAELFRDPLANTIRDEEHSEREERWVTVGRDTGGRALVVVHTFHEISPKEAKVRIISARKPTKRELMQYHGIGNEEGIRFFER
jgi:uncharacterized protein